MGTTTRFGFPYLELTDAPNLPLGLKALAEGVEGWTARAIPCLSTSRPGTPPDGMIIRETDTGARKMFDGTNWIDLAATGAPTTVEAQYAASSAQSIPTSALTAIAFGTAETTHASVVRTVRGSGHQFELALAGRWTVDLAARWAPNAAVGERTVGLFNAAAGTGPPLPLPLKAAGGSGPSAVTCELSRTARYPAGTVLYAAAWQDTGGGRVLDHNTAGLGVVRINLTYVGP